jgi:tetratricopeptide (TPR) repeat protein
MGKRGEALKQHSEALKIRSALAKEFPDVPEYQNELAGTHHALGSLLDDMAKREEARKEYGEAVRIRSALAKAHPDVTEYQSELAQTHHNLGVLLKALGKRDEALRAYTDARKIRSVLAKAHSDRIDYQVGLGWTCFNRGALLVEMDDGAKEALADLDQGLAATDRVQKIDARHPMVPTFLRLGLPRRAALLDRLGRGKDADADWDRLLALTPGPQRPAVRLQRADSRARAGDYLRAADDVKQLADSDDLTGSQLYYLAWVQALNTHHASRDAARPLPQREKRAEGYAKDAIALLKRAKDAKFFNDPKNVETLSKDDDLASLRLRADFRAFVAGLEQK